MDLQLPGGDWAWGEFDAVFETWKNHNVDRYVKELRGFVILYSWQHIFPLDDKHLFYRRALAYYLAVQKVDYFRHRQSQIFDGSYPNPLVVFRAGDEMSCGALHGDLEGLVVPSDHRLVDRYMPPKVWNCGCRIFGARSMSSAQRLQGIPGKPVPSWAETDDPATGLAARVDALFADRNGPSRRQILAAVARGDADLL